VLLVLLCGSLACHRPSNDEYKVLAFSEDGLKEIAKVRSSRGDILSIECYGSTIKGTDLSSPGYRTVPDKPATWEGVVGTDHWRYGCRPLPIGWTVTMVREKYPANYLEYDASQEKGTDTYFGHSYWKIVSQD
jgi:hypothetical protein